MCSTLPLLLQVQDHRGSGQRPPGDNGQVCLLYVADGQQDQITNQVISYQPHNYVYPIPQSQIDLNPNLIQNPGY